MKVIGTSSCGAVIIEMHARDCRDLKRLAEALAGLPEIEGGDDGVVRVAEKSGPARARPAVPVRKAAGKRRRAGVAPAAGTPVPQKAGQERKTKACAVCTQPFHPRTSEICCSAACRQKLKARRLETLRALTEKAEDGA